MEKNEIINIKNIIRQAALVAGITSTVIMAIIVVLLLAAYIQLKLKDPINDPVLAELRSRYEHNQSDVQLKARIRELDYLARAVYFSSQRQIEEGRKLAVMAGIIAILGYGISVLFKKPPLPGIALSPEILAAQASLARKWMIAISLFLCLVTVGGFVIYKIVLSDINEYFNPDTTGVDSGDSSVLSVANKEEMLKEQVGEDKKLEKTRNVSDENAVLSSGTGDLNSVDTDKKTDLYASINCPSFRGIWGNGFFKCKDIPVEWDEENNKNILWKAKVKLPGLSSPVVWEDRVFLTGATRNKREVYAYDLKTGKLLWTGTYKSDPKASSEYEVYEDLEKVMHAACTPCVDGERCYAVFANGEMAAFEIKTGKNVWSRLLGDTSGNQYGYANSLAVYKEDVIVLFTGSETFLARIEGATGKEKWRVPFDAYGWSSPSITKDSDGRWMILTGGDPNISGWDIETGKKIWGFELVKGDVAPSPIAVDGIAYMNFVDHGIFAIEMKGNGRKLWSITELEKGKFSETTSLTGNGDYLYQFNEDLLVCIDVKEGKVLYEQTLEESSSYASPIIINNKLYLFCGETTIVVEVGPEYKEVSRGKLQEYSDVNPAVVDGKLLIRTEKSLYAIGFKEKML